MTKKQSDTKDTTEQPDSEVRSAEENVDDLPEMQNITSDADIDADVDVDVEPQVDVESLVQELAATASERDEYKDQLLRARAEFENFRKRVARESEQTRRMAAANLIRELLPVSDNLDLALQHVANPDDSLVQGVRMVMKQFNDALERAGLQSIAAQGESFDPNVHEAVMQQNSDDVPAGTVITEFQRGYRLGDQVLRPARVVVSAGPAANSDDSNDETSTANEASND